MTLDLAPYPSGIQGRPAVLQIVAGTIIVQDGDSRSYRLPGVTRIELPSFGISQASRGSHQTTADRIPRIISTQPRLRMIPRSPRKRLGTIILEDDDKQLCRRRRRSRWGGARVSRSNLCKRLEKAGARWGTRTPTAVASERVLSPLRLPIPPSGH